MANFRGGNLIQGQQLGNISTNITLTRPEQVLRVERYGVAFISSNSTTASSRRLTISQPTVPGQIMTIIAVSPAPLTFIMLKNDTNLVISDDWTPTQFDILQLIAIKNSYNKYYSWLEIGRTQEEGYEQIPVIPFSSKWTSSCTVAKLTESTAIFNGTFTSTENLNDDPMGIFPDGYVGVFSIPATANIASAIQIVDIGTSSDVFGMTPTANIGDFVYMSGIIYTIDQ